MPCQVPGPANCAGAVLSPAATASVPAQILPLFLSGSAPTIHPVTASQCYPLPAPFFGFNYTSPLKTQPKRGSTGKRSIFFYNKSGNLFSHISDPLINAIFHPLNREIQNRGDLPIC